MTFDETKGCLCCEERALSAALVVHVAGRLLARAIESLRDLHFTLTPPVTTELWSHEQLRTHQSPAQGFKYSHFADPSNWVSASTVMKHLYENRDAVILPGESKLHTLCIAVTCR